MARLIDDGPRPPAENMALDEAMLLAGRDVALRLYSWRPPAVSLGYFQAVAEFEDVAQEFVLVRRPTGGGAICHDREITFALAAPLDLLPGPIPESYLLVHEACVAALRVVGVPARIAAAPAAPPKRSRWCFARAAAGDVVLEDGRKLVGSAQRRVARPAPRVLHHGSLVLRAPAPTPFCGEVAAHLEPERAVSTIRRELARELGRRLGVEFAASTLTETELRCAQRLREERHANLSFVRRR